MALENSSGGKASHSEEFWTPVIYFLMEREVTQVSNTYRLMGSRNGLDSWLGARKEKRWKINLEWNHEAETMEMAGNKKIFVLHVKPSRRIDSGGWCQ